MCSLGRVGEDDGGAHDDEGQAGGRQQLPEPLPCVLGVGDPRGFEHVLVSAEEDRQLYDDEGEKERHEQSERDAPLPGPEPSGRPRDTSLERPAGGERQADRGEEDEQEGGRSPWERRSRRQRHPVGELRERQVRLDEQRPERHHEETAEEGPADRRRHAARHGRRESRRTAQANERTERGERAQPADRRTRQQPGGREVEGYDPVRVENRRDRCERESERPEHDTLGPRAHRGADGCGDEPGDDEHAESERFSGKSDGGRQGRSECRGSHCDSSTTMRQPCGSASSALIEPPWRSTIQRAMARPRPEPPSPGERAWSER